MVRRTIFALLLGIISVSTVQAQFHKAEVKIYGLTCSICSRSVEMALKKVSFIEDLDTDLETTATTIVFKEGATVSPEEIADAVEKAGFSVGYIKVLYNFSSSFTKCYEEDDIGFSLIGEKEQTTAGVHELLLIDKDLMSKKIFKEYKDSLPEKCGTNKRHYYVALADQLLPN